MVAVEDRHYSAGMSRLSSSLAHFQVAQVYLRLNVLGGIVDLASLNGSVAEELASWVELPRMLDIDIEEVDHQNLDTAGTCSLIRRCRITVLPHSWGHRSLRQYI